jgi:hypothetical protein
MIGGFKAVFYAGLKNLLGYGVETESTNLERVLASRAPI